MDKKYLVNYVEPAIEMAKFVEEKDTMYGNAVFNMIEEYGMDYALSKLTEKLYRLKQLKKLGKEDHSESFMDSLKDLWGYAFLSILYLEQVQGETMETYEEEPDEIDTDADHIDGETYSKEGFKEFRSIMSSFLDAVGQVSRKETEDSKTTHNKDIPNTSETLKNMQTRFANTKDQLPRVKNITVGGVPQMEYTEEDIKYLKDKIHSVTGIPVECMLITKSK